MPRSKYRILGLIGEGQFGRVFCAVHRQTGELVALKDLDRKRFPTKLFLRELDFLVSLQHPNIVAFQTVEYTQTGRYLVMDYCEGGTLRDLIESEGQLSPVQGLKLIADILLGLEYAHSRDIVHCDIKPENILLTLETTGWVARISDFGIARLVQKTGGRGTGRGYTGSPAYMAPERFYGRYSHASDLYAVGVLLFELLVGQRPFSGIPSQLMAAHLNQPVAVPDTVPFLLRSTISTALQKLPQRRFASAACMLKSIRLAAEALAATQPSTFFLSAPNLASSPVSPGSIRQERLQIPVTCLAVESQQVYLGTTDQIHCQTYTDTVLTGELVRQWQVPLTEPVAELSLRPQGCFAITRSQPNPLIDYSIYCLPRTQIASNSETSAPFHNSLDRFALLSGQSKELMSAIDPQGRWLAIAQIAAQSQLTRDSATFEILKLPSLQPVRSPVLCSLPSQLIALDSRYGLAIFPSQETEDTLKNGTIFRLFTRRGSFVGSFSLPLLLDRVTPSATSPYRLLAFEQRDPALGLLIDLKPFKVTPIALDITPAFVTATNWGYILTNRQGQVVLLDREGHGVGRFELPATSTAMISSQITAIATFAEYGLLIATWSDKQGILYAIDLRQFWTVDKQKY